MADGLVVVEGGKTGTSEPSAPAKIDKRGTPFYDVVDERGRLLIRVGLYHDTDVAHPVGMARFLDFFPVFVKEVGRGKWGAFVLDSVSNTALSARKDSQYSLNPDTNNPLQHYGYATDLIEEYVCMQIPALPCHVGVIFHVHREKIESEGKMARQPFVPGKRLAESKSVAACYPELWRMYAVREEGKKIRRMQTDSDERYIAGTCIGVEDEMVLPKNGLKAWDLIWSHYKGGDYPPLHVAVYADPHVGKSSLWAGFARWLASKHLPPMYVALFDGRGKDMPYRLVGRVEE